MVRVMNRGTGGGKQSFSLLCEPVEKEVPITHGVLHMYVCFRLEASADNNICQLGCRGIWTPGVY